MVRPLHAEHAVLFAGELVVANTADPISSLRAIMLSNAWNDISPACAKLDHAANAMRLRCADGSRDASSKKTPRVT